MTLTTQENYNKSIVRGWGGEFFLSFIYGRLISTERGRKTCVDGVWKKNEEKKKVKKKKWNGKKRKINKAKKRDEKEKGRKART